jgi:tRNA(Ile)-lysidine synthase
VKIDRLNLGAGSIERFARDLDGLIAPGARIGVAVSGGPDSIALLLLAAAARPDMVEAATVDHALRSGSRDEAEMVGRLCERLGISHHILTAEWSQKPQTAIQEHAREARYRLLSAWASERQLDAIVTAHHLDDQAETLVMRLMRGAGVRGLAAMRPLSTVPTSGLPLLRPLLGWRRFELAQICASAGLVPAADPSNEDEQFERVRVRRALADADWLDATSLAAALPIFTRRMQRSNGRRCWSGTALLRMAARKSSTARVMRPRRSAGESSHGSWRGSPAKAAEPSSAVASSSG